MIGVRYPNGEVCPIGGVNEALHHAETAHVQTRLVRQDEDGGWYPDPRLPRPRPRSRATPDNPVAINSRAPVRRGRGRGRGRQTVEQAETVGSPS